jgi:hypothetical protein
MYGFEICSLFRFYKLLQSKVGAKVESLFRSAKFFENAYSLTIKQVLNFETGRKCQPRVG